VIATTRDGKNLLELEKEIASAVASGSGPHFALDFLLGALQRKLDLQDPRQNDDMEFHLWPFSVRRVPENDSDEDQQESSATGLEVGARVVGALRVSSTIGNTNSHMGVWLNADQYQERRETDISGKGKVSSRVTVQDEAENLPREEPDPPHEREHHFYIDTELTRLKLGGDKDLTVGTESLTTEQWYHFECYTETEAPFRGDSINIELQINLKAHAESTFGPLGTNQASIIITEIQLFLTPLHVLKRTPGEIVRTIDLEQVNREIMQLFNGVEQLGRSLVSVSEAAQSGVQLLPAPRVESASERVRELMGRSGSNGRQLAPRG
jgi:hypothetical protein